MERKASNVSLSDYKYVLKNGVLTKTKLTEEDIKNDI